MHFIHEYTSKTISNKMRIIYRHSPMLYKDTTFDVVDDILFEYL